MKNLNLTFAILIATVFMFASCQKENIEDTQPQTQKTEFITGEELPTVEDISPEEAQAIRDQQIASFKKEGTSQQLAFGNTKGISSSTRGQSIIDIDCGRTVHSSTRGESDKVSKYRGSDKVYLLELHEDKKVNITLSHLHADLDMFFTEAIVDAHGRKSIGHQLAYSTNRGRTNENIEVEVSSGKYFIIIETYDFESDFTLNVDCRATHQPKPKCEYFDNLHADYHVGISEQSDLWNLWNHKANDGYVLYENAHSHNKVIKFDYGKFGYQDAVRDLLGSPITRKGYSMNFDLYIPHNGVAEMMSEKTGHYGEEESFYLRIDNGRLSVKSRGKTYNAHTSVPSNTWVKVIMTFDMESNSINISIGDIRISMKADNQVESTRQGSKSIYGVGFFADEHNSKFYIDNVCVREIDYELLPLILIYCPNCEYININ